MAPWKTDNIYIPGEVQGVKIQFLYDTGATCTFISQSIWKEIPVEERPKLQKPDRDFLSVDGRPLQVIGKAPLQLVIEGQAITFPIWVGEIADDGIIGLDLLAAYQCQWDWSQGKLLFGRLNSVCLCRRVHKPKVNLDGLVVDSAF